MSDFSVAERISAYVKANGQIQVRKWFIHSLISLSIFYNSRTMYCSTVIKKKKNTHTQHIHALMYLINEWGQTIRLVLQYWFI